VNAVVARLQKFVADALDRPSAMVKQMATVGGLVFALALVVTVPDIQITHGPTFVASIVLVALATGLAALMGRDRSLARYIMIIPAIDLIALGFFRAATGANASLFAALIILPVIWLASGDGRRFIAYAGVGTSVALMLPFFLGLITPSDTTDWVRGIFAPIVFAMAAGIVNELSRQSRNQIRSIKQLADDKERMLQRTVEYAAQLQESEAKYRVADRMFRGVWAAVTEQSVIGTDKEGLIDAWNPGATKLLGPTAEETEDRMHIFDFHVPEELEDYARELNYPPGETVLNPGFSALVESARLGRPESREWTYVRSDGTHVPVHLTVTRRVSETGSTRGYLFVASDVTQAREVVRLKDEFVGLISHELRTPLSSILGYLELMRDDEQHPLSEEQLQYLGVAERNAHRLLRLVGDLLFTAQVESGTFPLDTQQLSLAAIVTAAVETARPMADTAKIELSAELPSADALVTGDALRLGQAVDNLVSNAIKFTEAGGKVTVALSVVDSFAEVTVTDTGLGIAADEVDQLFSRFFRASTATRNAVPGVGLGLSITKAIVTAHEGSMDVESEEGVGTRFRMRLPLVAAAG
jgi:signal transduction histidine kinase